MTELDRARGGYDIRDVLNLSRSAYNWLTHEYNPDTLQRVERARAFLRDSFTGEPVDIETRIDDLGEQYSSSSSATLDVKSKTFCIIDMSQFSKIKDLCDSFVFVPHTDGTVGIELYFRNIIRPIERR